MSEYGADAKPDMNQAERLAKDFAFMPFDRSNVMQWTYANGVSVQKLASKQGKSNLLIKYQK